MKPLVYKKAKRVRHQAPVRMRLTITKGDTVQVISGDDKGKRGRVMEVFPKTGRIKIEGVNIITKHVRASQTTESGIVKREAPIHHSKAMLIDPGTNAPTRIRRQRDAEGPLHAQGEAGAAAAEQLVLCRPEDGEAVEEVVAVVAAAGDVQEQVDLGRGRLAQRVEGLGEVVRPALDVIPPGAGVAASQVTLHLRHAHRVVQGRALGVRVDEPGPPAGCGRLAAPARRGDPRDQAGQDQHAEQDPQPEQAGA